MTEIEEKDKAWREYTALGMLRVANYRQIFGAGWEAALANRPIVVETIRLVARQNERAEIRARIMELVGEAFAAEDDPRAMHYRQLANELFGKQPPA